MFGNLWACKCLYDFMCMGECTCTWLCVYMFFMYKCMYMYICVYFCVFDYVCMHMNLMCTFLWVYICKVNVCVCMFSCVCVIMGASMFVCKCLTACMWQCACLNACIWLCMCLFVMWTCMLLNECMYVCVFVHMCVHMYVCWCVFVVCVCVNFSTSLVALQPFVSLGFFYNSPLTSSFFCWDILVQDSFFVEFFFVDSHSINVKPNIL